MHEKKEAEWWIKIYFIPGNSFKVIVKESFILCCQKKTQQIQFVCFAKFIFEINFISSFFSYIGNTNGDAAGTKENRNVCDKCLCWIFLLNNVD